MVLKSLKLQAECTELEEQLDTRSQMVSSLVTHVAQQREQLKLLKKTLKEGRERAVRELQQLGGRSCLEFEKHKLDLITESEVRLEEFLINEVNALNERFPTLFDIPEAHTIEDLSTMMPQVVEMSISNALDMETKTIQTKDELASTVRRRKALEEQAQQLEELVNAVKGGR